MGSPGDGDCVMHALRTRRSMPRVRPDGLPREAVTQIIRAATWAPNHRRTEPWRFTVISGDARRALGAVMERSLLEASAGELPGTVEATAAMALKERQKPLRAPVIVAVAAEPSNAPKVVPQEEFAAVAAGVQNMLLAAEALGLAAMWRTGRPAYDPAVKDFLGFAPQAEIVAFVYLGYPDLPHQPREQRVDPPVRWLG